MKPPTSLAEFRERGVVFASHEAIAIAQSLIHADANAFATHAPFGAPNLSNVTISADGAVACGACAATPAVFEVAILLQQMLPIGTPGVSGPLRYTLGRALLEVEAPPFDSLEEFSRALARFERGDRAHAVAGLYARASSGRSTALMIVPIAPEMQERRRHVLSSTELRRQLREADRRLFEERRAAPVALPARSPWSKRAPVAACLGAGLALIAAGEVMHVRKAALPSQPSIARDSAAPILSAPPPVSRPRVLHHPVSGSRELADAKPASAAPHKTLRPRARKVRAAPGRRTAGRASRRPETTRGVLARVRFEWDRDPFSQRLNKLPPERR